MLGKVVFLDPKKPKITVTGSFLRDFADTLRLAY